MKVIIDYWDLMSHKLTASIKIDVSYVFGRNKVYD